MPKPKSHDPAIRVSVSIPSSIYLKVKMRVGVPLNGRPDYGGMSNFFRDAVIEKIKREEERGK